MTNSGTALTACRIELRTSPTSTDPGPCIVRLSGELDLDTVPGMEARLADLAVTGLPELVLDLSGVIFCDTSGVNLFLRLHGRCRSAGTRLRLEAVPARPARVIRMLELPSVVPCTFQ